MIDPGRIVFRPVTPEDYPLLEAWMGKPHWREWWGEPETEMGYVRDMVEGRDSTRPFIFLVDGLAAGYIQVWSIRDHLAEPWLSKAPWLAEVPPDSVGVDMSIGEAERLSRGLGSSVLKAFVDRLRTEGHDTIVIDPDIANKRAVRAYQKAGFTPLMVSRESSDDADSTVQIMILARDCPDNDSRMSR